MYNFGEIDDVAYFMRRMYERGLTTTLGGNISKRSDNNTIFISPTEVDKGRLSAWQIGSVKLDGTIQTRDFIPSKEMPVHLEIYKKRPDIHAIIHSHPLYATTFSATSQLINTKLNTEFRYVLGNIVSTPYAKIGSEELARVVSEAAVKSNVIILENHGVITIGANLSLAFERLEVLDNAARMTMMTSIMGDKKELTDEQIAEIDNMIRKNDHHLR